VVQQSWLQWELGIVDPPLGGLFLIPRGGRSPVELAEGSLVLPGGVDVSKYGAVNVTAPVFGPGAVLRVRDRAVRPRPDGRLTCPGAAAAPLGCASSRAIAV
jgi:hypothetical protein